MGSAEGNSNTPPKTPKVSSAQDPASTNPQQVYPDWSSFQAYYNSGGTNSITPGFFPPVATNHPGHPYMWPAQHVIAPYGTPPPPYVAMYSHGGIYPHPHIPQGHHPYGAYAMPSNGMGEASILESGGIDLDSKTNDNGKGSGASANGGVSQSGESGAEGSSEGSDAQSPDAADQTSRPEENQNGIIVGNTGTQASATSTLLPHASLVTISPSAISGPTTTLNIGMDFWGGTASSVTQARNKLPVKPAATSTLSTSRDGVPSDLWLQDEREIKRQKRKQSNRESARRSRLRKQAECEELAQRVGKLTEENSSLAEELKHIREECERLTSENATLNERIRQFRGKEAQVDDDLGRPESSNRHITEN